MLFHILASTYVIDHYVLLEENYGRYRFQSAELRVEYLKISLEYLKY